MDKREPMAVKVSTRPQDWAAPARAHLFGIETLNIAERADELSRFSGGRPAYGEAALREAARLRERA